MLKAFLKYFLLLLIISITRQSFSQSWLWARSATGNYYDYGRDICTDPSGNVYVTGYFQSDSIVFGSVSLVNANISSDTADIFIVKYNSSGNVIWAKRFGGTGTDISFSISIDASGNIYVGGYFANRIIIFDNDTLTNTDTTGFFADGFLVKLNSSGSVLWAKGVKGKWTDEVTSLAADTYGNVYVTGYFQSDTIRFDNTFIVNGTSNGYADIFLAKFDTAGNLLWAKRMGGSSSDIPLHLTTDANGNVIFTGWFDSFIITFGSNSLTNGGSYDVFIAKYDSAGNAIWAKRITGSGYDVGRGVLADANGDIYVTGMFFSPICSFGTYSLTNAGGGLPDFFIAKYNGNSGNILWARGAGGNNGDDGFRLAIDASGIISATGYFGSPSITFGSFTLTNSGVFVVKYDTLGNVLYAKDAMGSMISQGLGIAVDVTGNTYVTGCFGLISIIFGNDTLINAGGRNLFLAKLSSTVGIQEVKLNLIFTIFPNPTNGIFTIKSQQEITEIKIYNVLGELISHLSLRRGVGGEVELNLSSQPKGIYFIQITANGNSYSQKLIIQ